VPPAGWPELDALTDALERSAAASATARWALEQTCLEILETLVEALESRDRYTAGHSRRVSNYSRDLARECGLFEDEVERIRVGALLHDIGKVGIPDDILLKDGRLSDRERAIIETHPAIGVRILERTGVFVDYLSIVGLHHENHDGSGYPNGLAGDDIPLDARIVHIADTYDAMTTDRPYRARLPEDVARKILSDASGTQFDPEVLQSFFASGIVAAK
jgi:putative nucleotidyltransferase with HDIG domain